MKNKLFFIAFIFVLPSIIITSCKKEEIQQEESEYVMTQYDNINQINTVNHSLSPSIWDEADSIHIDIDHDGLTDISIYSTNYDVSNQYRKHSGAITHNGFEFSIQSTTETNSYNSYGLDTTYYDTVNIVAIHPIGGTIDTLLSYSKDFKYFAYRSYINYMGTQSYSTISGWNNQGYKYIGFRNDSCNLTGWLKLSITGYYGVELKSFYYTMNTNTLIIQE